MIIHDYNLSSFSREEYISFIVIVLNPPYYNSKEHQQ